jgi:acyl dehydratase
MPDFARAMLGTVKEGLPEPAWPLAEDEIHLWCECLEDWNPLYWDKNYANKSRYGGIIAPPAAMFFGVGSSVNAGIGYMKPGVKVPEAVQKGLTGLPLRQALREGLISTSSPFSVPGCPEVAVVQARADYFTRLRPGDWTSCKVRLLNCGPKKRTKLGEGHFVSWVNSMYNQKDELVRNFTLTVFVYHI